jgi:hypothetical protein
VGNFVSMKLTHNMHLAYCTNIHRGESWPQTFETLERYTLAVRARVSPSKPYAIGLRLGDQASRELSEPKTLASFRRWLDEQNCYVFTINGFPYGKFHGTRVKEQVYAPDWTTPERVDYTNRLFDLLAEILPSGIEGSVSTVPCSFKEFITSEDQVRMMRANLWRCVEHIAELSARTGKKLQLGLEPEPLCYLETSGGDREVSRPDARGAPERSAAARTSRRELRHVPSGVRIRRAAGRDFAAFRSTTSKSASSISVSALAVRPTEETRHALRAFVDEVYFHQGHFSR